MLVTSRVVLCRAIARESGRRCRRRGDPDMYGLCFQHYDTYTIPCVEPTRSDWEREHPESCPGCAGSGRMLDQNRIHELLT